MKSSRSSSWAIGGLVVFLAAGVLAQVPSSTPSTTSTAAVVPTQVPSSQPLPHNPVYPDTPRDNRTSPSFPDSEYVKLLDYSLRFYEAQRSGKLPPDQRVTWRKDSVLDDGKDVGLDLSGGYFDAGDYLKFTFPLTFAMTETCWGALEFWKGYELANQTRYLDQMVRWGMDWLIKAHPNNNTLFVQIGLDQIDNNYWGPDTNIPRPRPSFQVNNTHPGTDVTADAAAAFASCAMLYRDKFNDTAYSNTLQTHADSLFRLAETATPQQLYQAAVPAVACCYKSSSFLDDLAWGAAWMYKLTRQSVYAQKASQYIDRLNISNIKISAVSWDDKAGFVYVLMAGATAGTGDNSAKWQQMAEKYASFTTKASKPCLMTKGGLYYCTGDSGDDSAVVAANAAFILQIFASQLTAAAGGQSIDPSVQERIDSYRSFALGQVEYLLGDNPLKTPYVVGVHPNSPANPHSAPASGGTDVDNIDSSPEKMMYTIYGALVGGPDKNDRFSDIRSDWQQSEVALDYNAPFNGLMAYQVMTSEVAPPYVVIPAGRPDLPPILNGMEVWQIILIIVACIFVVIAIGAFVCYRKRDQIRAWANAKKEKKANDYSTAHPMKPTVNRNNNSNANTSNTNDNNQDQAVRSLAVPPPPPIRSNQQEQQQQQQQQQHRPVPPPPLPARGEPVLLENVHRS
ncbi:hypothetical protein BX616_010784 [Lobosporangium transversale]|uniref:Endoglucanase n=1 Tax=Lobosporangium transversale TaxID=64571 RepID=A0A1Y2GTP4_9FUNG|nr:Six-hairpin glycosidase-like protein [Lobosporangium transversale]KAF9910755.1 hypothetical protein BX616_010784 [Lobosporangium transversale]ORZ21719.1 Six-hairpin glycosidase-like protein [Lobosporangium transversale]|eukprot:XP_021882970.1 Six-hairpin glycosidase-like protein [Lobosporangium transversale]